MALHDAGHPLFAGGCTIPRLVLDLVDTAFCSDPAWDQTRAHDLVAHYTTAFLLTELTSNPDTGTLLAPHDQPPSPQVTYRAEGY